MAEATARLKYIFFPAEAVDEKRRKNEAIVLEVIQGRWQVAEIENFEALHCTRDIIPL